ncbi:histidine phosphatase family protein [Planococcus beigongshangi]|uniref:histidine phosphatase family protein n=1 Tax=Planococcus beigongshangi TaxID=2782536 RepID=UPI00193C58F6|nr:histidine phosphatase family protein [Planococcus beigongshangi]
MTTIGLVRHGITEWNELGIVQGSSNIPLNKTGREQAAALSERLAAEEGWDLIIASDLERAKETAEIIGARLGIPISHFDARLREMNGGAIEGTTEDERVKKWGAGWRSLDLGMETREAVAGRGAAALQDIVRDYPGKRVLAVSHGGLIGLTLQSLLPDQFTRTLLNNTSITILKNAEDAWQCPLFNCTRHLDGKVFAQ